MITPNEIWKEIDSFDNYKVSNLGNVRNEKRGNILKGRKSTHGYFQVRLCKYGEKKNHFIHRLVAQAFIPNPDGKPCVDHIFNNIIDNRVQSLRWCTKEENGRNAQLSSRNTSGSKGVSWDKSTSKWRASIMVDGVTENIGCFDSKEDAILARQTRANEAFGEFVNDCETL
jgi:hypothetical protein